MCHETGNGVENPYHNMSAILKDPISRNIAYSNLEVSLGDEAFRKIRGDLQESPEKIKGLFGYAVETQTGSEGGFSGSIQCSGSSEGHRDYRFLDKAVASAKLPKSARDLKKNPEWMEQTKEGWKNAEWAAELYAKLQPK